jgi:RNase H-fold protein (predicted Holliday junction resolvase)
MTETERLLSQTLARLEQNLDARLALYDQRLKTQEDNQMLLQSDLRTLKRLFSDVSEVYASLQTILLKLRSNA